MTHATPLVLGSSSPFRRQALAQLGVEFQVISPDIDETPHATESAEQLVRRLSLDKARAVAAGLDTGLVIGSDQVAVIDGEILGKPLDHERAVQQLRRASGGEVRFLTGLSLVNAATGREQIDMVPVHVGFRELDEATIDAYLRKDRPYSCAGSIRSEASGVCLFRYVRSDDPSALIGLPLIRLCEMLAAEGFDVLRR